MRQRITTKEKYIHISQEEELDLSKLGETTGNDALYYVKIFLISFYRSFVVLSIFIFLIFLIIAGEGLVYWLEYLLSTYSVLGIFSNLIYQAIWKGKPYNPGTGSAASGQLGLFQDCKGDFCGCPQVTRC